MELNKFPCNSCGLCCQNIGHIEELQLYDRGDGTCKYLINNQCSIYQERPLVCRVEDMFEKFFCEFFSKIDYYKKNLLACKKMQQENGLSEEDQLDLNKILGE